MISRRPMVETLSRTVPRGAELLRDPELNKGSAFTSAERLALGLQGLLPPRVSSMEEQVARVLANCRGKSTPLGKYIFLTALQDRNETLFYRVLLDNLAELMPIVYTPTVGEACQSFGRIFRRTRGIYLTRHDRGSIAQVLRNWPHADVRVIVATDGGRILGLGDLGANGMGIPIGKLALYTACAGVQPKACLPIVLDLGTDNDALHKDPTYMGLREHRVRGAAYAELIDELVDAVQEVFPRACIQFEDWAGADAVRLLARYRDRVSCFNDDIQGTGAMALAGILSAVQLTGSTLGDQRFLFLGAGSAGTGIAEVLTQALVVEGLTPQEARQRSWFFDIGGLIESTRTGLAAFQLPFAHAHRPTGDFVAAIESIRPTAIIGVSTVANAFDRRVIEAMSRINPRPIIFPLSNPTSRSECTAEQAIGWSEGRAVFASGSPFMPVEIAGRTVVPRQANNVYIFPGVGLGVAASEARRVTDEMFIAAARTLAAMVTPAEQEAGSIYPALERIREVSLSIATAVAELAWSRGLTALPRPPDVRAHVASGVYQPVYRKYVE